MFELLLLLLTISFLGAAIWNSYCMLRTTRGWRWWLVLTSSALVVTGAGGFFGQALFASGGQHWLPQSFEWPAGTVEDALITADGAHIILVRGVGRVQVYDSYWHFLRGWTVPAVLRLRLLGNGNLEALTKGEKGFVFDTSGNLISKHAYETREFVDLENSLPHTGSVLVPTPRLLYIFSSPFLSWLVFGLGFLGWFTLSPRSNYPNNPQHLSS